MYDVPVPRTVLKICDDLFWNLYVVVNYFIFRIISKGAGA